MATTSIRRKIHGRAGQTAHRGRSKKGQAKIGTSKPVGNGFLNHCFQPLATEDALVYSPEGEACLLSAFSNLADLYGYDPADVSGGVFPLNIRERYQQAVERLAEKDAQLELALVETDGRVRLATVKQASTGSTLFYLPVYPLWDWGRDKSRKQEVRLMLSVFAYLHQTVGIPFFNGWSYIGSHYLMLRDWIEDDDGEWVDTDEQRAYLSIVHQAIYFGERMHRQVRHPYHLADWGKRLGSFRVKDEKAAAIGQIAEEFWKLFTDYPQCSLGDNIVPEFLQPNEDTRMMMEQVFSFIWSDTGWAAEQLFETVSAELNECAIADDPLALQYFDTPQEQARHDLAFEERLYELLHELSDVLRMMI